MRADRRDRSRTRRDGLPSSEWVYRRLREMILTGELQPRTRLVELHLAEQFEVSRTPVREALKRLAAEQLVVADPMRGLIVHAPGPHEIEDVYRVRDALDALAVRLAAVRITPEAMIRLKLVLESMRDAIEHQRIDQVINANMTFHGVIYEAAGSVTLSRLATELSDFVRRFSSGAFSDPERANEVLREHEKILQALERHDGDAAAEASSAHLRTASTYLVETGLRQQADGAGNHAPSLVPGA
jgi:DNA-binding GntR family transcriptional regulator